MTLIQWLRSTWRTLLITTVLCFSITTVYAYPVDDLKHLNPKYATIGGGVLEYYRFGSGTPIVLISGFGTDVTSWNQHFLAKLANQHDVIVIKNRNVGGSNIRTNSYASKDLANELADSINAFLSEGKHNS